ncbi:unnamed protein product, partial [Lampetra fluviatilis]
SHQITSCWQSSLAAARSGPSTSWRLCSPSCPATAMLVVTWTALAVWAAWRGSSASAPSWGASSSSPTAPCTSS